MSRGECSRCVVNTRSIVILVLAGVDGDCDILSVFSFLIIRASCVLSTSLYVFAIICLLHVLFWGSV